MRDLKLKRFFVIRFRFFVFAGNGEVESKAASAMMTQLNRSEKQTETKKEQENLLVISTRALPPSLSLPLSLYLSLFTSLSLPLSLFLTLPLVDSQTHAHILSEPLHFCLHTLFLTHSL